MNKNLISLANRLTWTKYGLIQSTVEEVLQIIKSGEYSLTDSEAGNYNLKVITEAIRNSNCDKQRREWKEMYVPVVTFNGVWDGHRISHYSNITALDFDYLGNAQQKLDKLTELKQSPHILAVFRTFKPFRLKALVMHDNSDPDKHGDLYEQLMAIFGVDALDSSCKDLSRKTFLPWDEEIWINSNCSPYHFIPSPKSYIPVNNSVRGHSGKCKSSQSIKNILNASWKKNHPEYWERGNRAMSVFKCACQFCEYGVPEDVAKEYFISGWIADDFNEDEILKQVEGGYNNKKEKYGSKNFY